MKRVISPKLTKIVFNVEQETVKKIQEKCELIKESTSVVCRLALQHGLKHFDFNKIKDQI